MNQLLPYAPLLLLLGGLFATAICHALVHLFLLVKLPRAAAWIAANTLTISRFLPAAVLHALAAQTLAGAVGVVVNDLEEAVGAITPESAINSVQARPVSLLVELRRVLGLTATALFFVFLPACKPTTADIVHSAADVANGIAQFEQVAAPVVHERCTAPMEAIAKLAPSEDPAGKAKALAKTCDPMVEAYDGTRRTHIQLLSLLAALASGGVTVKDVFDELGKLTASAAQLEKEIATP